MADTRRNAALIENRSGELQRVHDAAFAWKTAEAAALIYAGNRGFWPMSVFDADQDAVDHSGRGHDLSNAGEGNLSYGRGATTSMAPWVYFSGANWLRHTDDADFDIQGDEAYVNAANRGLTLFCWVRLDSVAGTQFIIGKWDAGDCAYGLILTGGVFRAYISNTGAGLTHQAISTVTPAVDLWYFIAMTFRPSTALNVFVGGATEMGTWNSLAAAVPATIANCGADFTIGAEHGGVNPMTGFVSCALVGIEQWSGLAGAIYRDILVEAYYHHTRAMYGR